MSSLEEFFHSRDNLERVIESQYATLELNEKSLSTERCPNRDELAPILNCIQKLSTAIATFLEAINKAANDPVTRSELEGLPFEKAMPNQEIVHRYMTPRYLLIPLANAFYRNHISTSLRWEKTFELAIWYSEYRNSIANLSYIIRDHKYFTADSSWIWNWLKNFSDQHRIAAFHYMAERASFLEAADEHELENGSATWWCQRIDSFPKTKEYYDIIIGFIENCPDPKYPLVVQRLKDLLLLSDTDENKYYSERREIIIAKVLSILESPPT